MKQLSVLLIAVLLAASCLKQEDYHIDLAYSGEQLRYISCPLGGIGTGNILLNGYGAIRNIEIFNRPDMDDTPPGMTFFSLYARAQDQEPVVRVLEREFLDEYPNPFGKPRQQLGGLPRFREATFHNAYPVVRLDLVDEKVPLDITMSAWSPFVPEDTKNSSLPAAVMEWNLFNPGKVPIDFSVAFTMGNPLKAIAADGQKSNEGCVISPYESGSRKGVTFSSPAKDSLQPDAGTFRVLFPEGSILSIPLHGDGKWDDAQLFWNDFSSDGQLTVSIDSLQQSESEQGAAAMCVTGTLAPGESAVLPFLFTWHVPFRKPNSNMVHEKDGLREGLSRNYYSVLYNDIDAVTDHLLEHFDVLREKTLRFSEAMITSSVPPPVLDAAISNMAALKTNLIMQDGAGYVYGYEGLGNNFATGAGNCTHVWNYAQTMAVLFPSLERNMRETGFNHSTFENGYQVFRTEFPLSDHQSGNIAADGQMGNIMRVYREWKMSGDATWLGLLWPNVQRALEFAWKGAGELKEEVPWMGDYPVPWDPNKEGVLHGAQYTTYDISFLGPNMMTGSLYLGALKACSEMALAMNQPQKSVAYKELFLKGRKRYMELLWNGEYFTQLVEAIDSVNVPDQMNSPGAEGETALPRHQVGEGCLSDQLLGQYLAFVSGLGYIMDTTATKQALESVYTYNFRQEMRNVENVQRIFAANGEPGLVICSWPNGNRPLLPFAYSDEVWTGVEYQVATSMIFADLVDEGLEITEAARSRYNGSNRNPFAEIESGRYFARAMSSWGVYQAMAGYQYDGTKKVMKFDPADDVLPIRFFWSAGTGWGKLEVTRAKIHFTCLHGTLDLKELVLVGRAFFVFREFEPSHDVEVSYEDRALRIGFKEGITLHEGEEFNMELP